MYITVQKKRLLNFENIYEAKYEAFPTTKFSDRITDKKLIDFLENQEHITTYKAMLLLDGKLYPPMASKVKNEQGKYVMSNPREVGFRGETKRHADAVHRAQ